MADEDVAAVMELERAVFHGEAWTEGMLRSEVAEPTRYYIVAVQPDPGERMVLPGRPGNPERGEILGYAGLRMVPPEGDVQTIAVSSAQWGRGIGAALLTGLLDRARQEELTEVFLEVRSDNPRAQELYRRFGFTEIGTRRNYYRDADAIVMRRTAPEQERPSEGSHHGQ
ncbi:ribosomal protein S18-alanine N-acetyltransferase [Haloactinospora alba]|nr:ribosomal protein S18-alanine N-acetyltransferase [Haloactinospora alba]